MPTRPRDYLYEESDLEGPKWYDEKPCETCGSEDADYQLDPYQAEIHNVEEHRWLCTYCYQELQQDI